MSRHYLALTTLGATLGAAMGAALAAGSAQAKPFISFDTLPSSEGLNLPEYGFALAPAPSAVLAPEVKKASRPAAPGHRMPSATGPSSDFWANLPNPAMRYRTGKTGPVVQLGAFNGDIPPLRPEREDGDAGALAHFTFAWNF